MTTATIAQPPATSNQMNLAVGQTVYVHSGVHYFGGMVGTISKTYPKHNEYAVALSYNAAPAVHAVIFSRWELEVAK